MARLKKNSKAFLMQMEAEDEQIVKKAMDEYLKKMLIETDKTNAVRMMIRFWAKWHEEVERIEAERRIKKER